MQKFILYYVIKKDSEKHYHINRNKEYILEKFSGWLLIEEKISWLIYQHHNKTPTASNKIILTEYIYLNNYAPSVLKYFNSNLQDKLHNLYVELIPNHMAERIFQDKGLYRVEFVKSFDGEIIGKPSEGKSNILKEFYQENNNSTNQNNKDMNSLKKWTNKLLNSFLPDDERDFRAAGFKDECGEITPMGKSVFDAFLWEKHKAEFHKEVVRPGLEEEAKEKDTP